MGGERGDAGFSATSKSGSTSLFNIGWLVAVLEVGAHGKGDKPVMTWRVVLGPAAISIEDKRARDTPDTSQEIVVFLCNIVSPRYLISSLSSPLWVAISTGRRNTALSNGQGFETQRFPTARHNRHGILIGATD